jgi:hypothetical protein
MDELELINLMHLVLLSGLGLSDMVIQFINPE